METTEGVVKGKTPLTKELLHELYWVKRLSTYEMAQETGWSPMTIYHHMKKEGVRIRRREEAIRWCLQRKLERVSVKGERVDHWMDGTLEHIHKTMEQGERPYASSRRGVLTKEELERLEAFVCDYGRENEYMGFVWGKFWMEFRQECYPDLRRADPRYRKIYRSIRLLCDPEYRVKTLKWIKKYAQTHKEEIRRYRKEYYQENKELWTRIEGRREGEREIVKNLLGGKCKYCGKPLGDFFEFHEERWRKEYWSSGKPKRPSKTTWFRRSVGEGVPPTGVCIVHPHKCHRKEEKLHPQGLGETRLSKRI